MIQKLCDFIKKLNVFKIEKSSFWKLVYNVHAGYVTQHNIISD